MGDIKDRQRRAQRSEIKRCRKGEEEAPTKYIDLKANNEESLMYLCMYLFFFLPSPHCATSSTSGSSPKLRSVGPQDAEVGR